MMKRKDSVALFDLINKGRTPQTPPGLNVPGWFHKRPAPPPPPVSEDMPPDPSAPPDADPDAAIAAATPPSPASVPASSSPFLTSTSPSEPLLSTAGNRVRISLNYASCAMVVMGFIAVLGIVFWAGRVSRSAASPAGAGAENPAGGGSRAGGGGAENSPSPSSAAGDLVKGKYYLIVDRMAGLTEQDRKDAEAIVAYLAAKGRPAMVVNVSAKQFGVLSLTPFDRWDTPEARDFAKGIMDLGRAYVPPRGCRKYNFNQESRPGKLDPSWHLQQQ